MNGGRSDAATRRSESSTPVRAYPEPVMQNEKWRMKSAKWADAATRGIMPGAGLGEVRRDAGPTVSEAVSCLLSPASSKNSSDKRGFCLASK
jgi:hypothetical protein